MTSRRLHAFRRPALTTSRRVALAGVIALAAVTLTPAVSHADTSSTITVVGTSDVFDSDLMQDVIQPDFEKAYPQYTLNYVSQGTGAAISYAEAGTASALLVHAASLENQFVASGFSDEQYGRAIFYGDYVLLGPAADPAGVLTNAPHDIVKAFEDIATAGAAGDANFVSRGGTPGTTVEEHDIWALTSGVTTCTVSAANGGGTTPSTTSGACPQTAPAWYHTTGLTQAPNVEAADTCNFSGGNCYVLTDRGTYQYLEQEGAISHLGVVTKDNSATATGDQNLLINSFHAYAINPNAPAFAGNSNVHINLPGAIAFLNWLTSPTGQADVNAYQASDPGGASFHEDAAPALTGTMPANVAAGKTLTVTGSLTNKVPGTPSLAGVAVTLHATPAGSSKSLAVATGSTDASGNYTLTYKPSGDASYSVSSAAISQIEIPSPTLTPPFGDLLQPTSTALGQSTVTGAATITKISAHDGTVTIKGSLAPAVSGSGAQLKVYATHTSAAATLVATHSLASGAKTFSVKLSLARGKVWKVRVRYVNTGKIAAGTSATRSVHVT